MAESEIQRVSKTHELRASHSKRALVVKGELRELKRKGMNTLEVCESKLHECLLCFALLSHARLGDRSYISP